MNAVDTNVLVRLLTGDHPRQHAVAKSFIATEPVWIAKTVLLETAWVLDSVYGFEEPAIVEAFARLMGLTNVSVEDGPSVAVSLALTTQGVDLADALHLTSRPPGAAFASFDRTLIRRARRAVIGNAIELA